MYKDSNFASTLTTHANKKPDKTALIEPNTGRTKGKSGWQSITFGDLDNLANRYATGLARIGVRRGDSVLYLLRPSIDSYAVFYALLRLGAIPAFIDPRMGLRRVLSVIECIRPRVVLAVQIVNAIRTIAPRAFATVELHITSGPRLFWGYKSLKQCLAECVDFIAEPSSPNERCLFPFTSGSTGPPKGVFYTHDMMRSQVALLHDICGWTEDMRVVMCYAPFVPFALAYGLTTILPEMDFSKPAAARPNRILDALTVHGAHSAFAAPIIWMNLVRYCEKHQIKLPQLREAVTAGAPVQIDLHRRLQKILHPEGRLHTPYGATEAMPITTTDTHNLAETWKKTRNGFGTCIGRPVRGVKVLIISVTDDPIPTWSDDLCVQQGAIGELVVDGAMVSPIYPENPEETARAKIRHDGRILHRMGDLGRFDSEGRVWFCGRKSHRIETCEGILAPVLIENILNEHRSVFRSAVVGIGPPGQQTPVAWIELEQGQVYSQQLESELVELMDATSFKGIVRRFLQYRSLPVDARHNSKINREALAVWAGKRYRQNVGNA